MTAKVVAILSLPIVAGLAVSVLKSQLYPLAATAGVPATVATTSSRPAPSDDPNITEIDNQNGVKIIATYLPSESTPTVVEFWIEISSVTVDLTQYDYSREIVLADEAINPLPTVSVTLITAGPQQLTLKMGFPRLDESHYHLLVRELGGIHDRVLHYYDLPNPS